MRPGAGGKLAGNSKAQKSSKTHPVEPGGTRGKILYLTWEIFPVRAGKKSADAVVAKKRGNARGAKGGRSKAALEKRLKGSWAGI